MSSEMNALLDAVTAVTSRKRKNEDETASAPTVAAAPSRGGRRTLAVDPPQDERRQHNRVVAIESRKRKKEMEGELHTSIAFFTSANASTKSLNAELERQILLAKQRIMLVEKGIPVAAPSAQNQADILALLRPPKLTPEAESAHFCATQAMYELQGFPPAAARQAASTFAPCRYASQGLSRSVPSVARSSSKKPGSVEQQDAHFAANVAKYKSKISALRIVGTGPGGRIIAQDTRAAKAIKPAAKPAARAKPDVQLQVQNTANPPVTAAQYNFPGLTINAGESYVDALNRFAMQQAAAANAAAALAAAAWQAARYHSQNNGNSIGASSVPVSHTPTGVPNGNGLNDLIAMLQANNGAEKRN